MLITSLAGLWQGSEVDREVLCAGCQETARGTGRQGIAKSGY